MMRSSYGGCNLSDSVHWLCSAYVGLTYTRLDITGRANGKRSVYTNALDAKALYILCAKRILASLYTYTQDVTKLYNTGSGLYTKPITGKHFLPALQCDWVGTMNDNLTKIVFSPRKICGKIRTFWDLHIEMPYPKKHATLSPPLVCPPLSGHVLC